MTVADCLFTAFLAALIAFYSHQRKVSEYWVEVEPGNRTNYLNPAEERVTAFGLYIEIMCEHYFPTHEISRSSPSSKLNRWLFCSVADINSLIRFLEKSEL